MRKIILVLLVLAMIMTMMVGCSISDASSNSETPKNGESIISSYENILNEYSKKLREATPKLIKEYNE